MPAIGQEHEKYWSPFGACKHQALDPACRYCLMNYFFNMGFNMLPANKRILKNYNIDVNKAMHRVVIELPRLPDSNIYILNN